MGILQEEKIRPKQSYIKIFEEIEKIKLHKHLSAPMQVSLYLTNKCQLNCKFCYFKEKMRNYNPKNNLNLNEWKKIIDEIKEIGVPYISLLGGEPTLYEEILELLNYINDKKIKTTITTNGINWTEDLIKCVCQSEYITPSISLQSLNEKTNRMLMGCSPKPAIDLISKFIKNGKTPRINTVITIQNENEIFELIKYCYINGIYDFFTNIYMDKFDDDKVLSKSFAQYRKFKEKIMECIEKNNMQGMNFQLQGCLMYSAYNELDFRIDNEYEYIKYGCEAGNTKIEIMPNGDIYPCAAFSKSDFEYCNTRNQSIKYIWDNAKYINLLRKYKNKDYKCVSCKFYKLCNGGCPAYNIKRTNSLEKEGDKRCLIIQNSL